MRALFYILFVDASTELYESGSEDNDDDDDEDDDGGDDSSSSEHVSSEHASYTVEEEVEEILIDETEEIVQIFNLDEVVSTSVCLCVSEIELRAYMRLCRGCFI